MDLSLAKTKEAKKLNVPVQFLIMADLCSIGYSEQDAYTIAYPENAALSVQQNKGIRESILKSAKFKKAYEERRNHIKSGVAIPIPVDDVEIIGTEEVIKEILRSARQQPVGSKERADLFAKYNDIKTKSEQVAEESTDAIHFYLPIKCHQCPLFDAYNEYRKSNDEKEVRPVEMESIIRKADKIIRAAQDANE